MTAFPPPAEREAHVPLCLSRQDARDVAMALQRDIDRMGAADPARPRLAAVARRLDRARAALRPPPPQRSKTR